VLSVKGVFREGVAQPLEPVEGREGQSVIITFLGDETTELTAEEMESAWDTLEQLIKDCAVETGISDFAHQHDHYLYGKPRRIHHRIER
jgi:predicted DNA-binding antitoxin AbrB/MazE fold protein